MDTYGHMEQPWGTSRPTKSHDHAFGGLKKIHQQLKHIVDYCSMLHASTMKLDGFTMFQNHHFQYLSIGKSSIPMILYILHSYVSLLEGIKIIKEEHGDFFAISERNGSDDAWG